MQKIGSKRGTPATRQLRMTSQLVSHMRKHVLRALLLGATAGLVSVSAAQAELIYNGNFSPDPTTWTSSTRVYIGNTADGSLTVNNGSTLATGFSYLGNNAGVNGVAIVTGAGSQLTSSSNRFVGYNGNGTLYITNGGSVSNKSTFLGYNATSTSAGYVDGAGSSWTSTGIELGVNAGSTGSLTITNGGLVTNSGYLYVGERGTGSVMVDGAGSTLANSQTVNIGSYSASGRLTISNGGAVNMTGGSGYSTNIGLSGTANGIVTVDGAGSRFTSSSALRIGYSTSSTSKLGISDGGAVTASSVSINNISRLTTDVGSNLTVGGGSGVLTNAGVVRMVAGASAANGTYTPVSAGTWSNTGTIQALGGILNSDHTVTVNSAVTATAGNAVNMDLYTNQRGIVTDPATGKSVGLGFQASATPGTNLTFSASAINGTELSSLQSLLDPGKSVLSGWNFSTTGYSSGSPVYLSLFAGSGSSLSELTIWKYDGTSWGKFDASDLAYDKTFASFTATDLSGYAVSGATPTPLPAAVWLLGSGLAGLGFVRRRKG